MAASVEYANDRHVPNDECVSSCVRNARYIWVETAKIVDLFAHDSVPFLFLLKKPAHIETVVIPLLPHILESPSFSKI